jgi:O-antigen/teichoic acid export membrane protein
MAMMVGINLLIKPFWILVIDVAVQDRVGYEAYGEYISMFNLALILTMLLDFGINNYNSSSIANNPEILSAQFSQLVSLKLLLSVVYLILTFILAIVYGFSIGLVGWVLLLAFNQVLAHFSTFIRSNLTGLQFFRTDAWLSALDRAVMILLGLMMLGGVLFVPSISHFIWIQTLGYTAVVIVALLLVWPYLTSISIRFNRDLLSDIFRKTYPFAILAFIMLLYSKWDVLMMKKMLQDGDIQNGIYARAGRILEAATLMVGSTATIMLPLFARMIGNQENLTPISKSLIAVLIYPVAVFAIWASIYHRDVMGLLPVGDSELVFEVFAILILTFIPYTCMYVFGSMLTAKGLIRLLVIWCSIGLAISLAVNAVLIPKWGAIGAAIATLLTQSFVGFGKMYWAIRKIKLDFTVKDILAFPFFMIGTASLMWWLRSSELSFIISAMLGAAWYLIYVVLTQQINVQKMWAQINQFRHNRQQ